VGKPRSRATGFAGKTAIESATVGEKMVGEEDGRRRRWSAKKMVGEEDGRRERPTREVSE